MYFTRIRLPKRVVKKVTFTQTSLEESGRYLTIIGLIIGLLSGVTFLVAYELFENLALALILSIVASIFMTGAFHEDGIADFFDAFGGGWLSKEKTLEIMKDSRLGTFGSLALILILLTKYQSLTLVGVSSVLAVLIAGHSISRLAAGSFLFTHNYVRKNDDSYFKPMLKSKMKWRDLIILAVFGIVPLFFLGSPYYLLALPVLGLITFGFGRYFTSKIGGYTGDCLGATQQIVEVNFYLTYILITLHLV